MRCAITASMIGVVLEIELGRCKVYIRVRWGQVRGHEDFYSYVCVDEGKFVLREVDRIWEKDAKKPLADR
jgi:hypothetical protein